MRALNATENRESSTFDARRGVFDCMTQCQPIRWRPGQTELEHGLDETYEASGRRERDVADLTSCVSKRNVRQISRNEVNDFGHAHSVELTKVGSLEVCDASILPERAQQLPMANINREHVSCATVQQRLRESAGGSTEIQSHEAASVNAKLAQGKAKFGGAPKASWASNRDVRITWDKRSGTPYRFSVGKDFTCCDQFF